MAIVNFKQIIPDERKNWGLKRENKADSLQDRIDSYR